MILEKMLGRIMTYGPLFNLIFLSPIYSSILVLYSLPFYPSPFHKKMFLLMILLYGELLLD